MNDSPGINGPNTEAGTPDVTAMGDVQEYPISNAREKEATVTTACHQLGDPHPAQRSVEE
jgi:hypothetical protein